MLNSLFGDSDSRRIGEALYFDAVEQARQPYLYSDMGVPDTVDGRFDMIATHVFLILHRLKAGGDETQAASQALFDAMFGDMDRGLREMGAGDLGVGRRVKAMAKAFYGRVAAYENGLETSGGALAEAVLRNVFRGDEAEREAAKMLADYISRQSSALSGQPLAAFLSGKVAFAATAPSGDATGIS
ncbi:MAG: hypothetical protein HOM58_21610 [Rhodospirillaceae bacterium]|jgi:cytochrome b pre-mRNA-processing protein 3|nr:hypothetical protein [Rhodospirillaceae bacterium]MBT5458812.1 hypothetical protein [Rhodospirillaceae bacterium]